MEDKISAMYSEAYNSYDSTNHTLSFFTDSSIREKAALEIVKNRPKRVIDLATGTGDLAIRISEITKEMHYNTKVIGLDKNESMLKIARNKISTRNLKNLKFEVSDVLKTKYQNSYFDVVSCSFSLKNFDVDSFTKEAHRILRDGGKLVITDISAPEEGFVGKCAFYLYFCYMELIGIVSGKKLYKWLPNSTAKFSKNKLIATLGKLGFKDLQTRKFFLGITYIIICRK
jgi:demethylmenaquinone methyltransferase / 2-methoxy-6-polyprenyl-1,4-benzoquinol methylase